MTRASSVLRSRARGCASTAALLLALLVPAAVARAHPVLPAAITLLEDRPGHYQLRFRRPTRLSGVLGLTLPAGCVLGEVLAAQELDQSIDNAPLGCTRSLEGQKLGVSGLASADLDAIAHVEHESGESARALLSASHESFVVPARTSWRQVLLQYGTLGARHMLHGLDHLLFTAGLLLLGIGVRALWLLSAFTLGHSVTLVLLAFGGLSLPQAPVELGIALSLIGLSWNVLARRPASDATTGPRKAQALSGAGLCFAVGLLHGLGFADGLKQLTLPSHAAASALLGFNFGIELAQLALVSVLAPCLWLAARSGPHAVRGLRVAVAYGTGSLAAMWCIERTLAWFT